MSSPDQFMKEAYEETRLQKLTRKCKEEPFVPAGTFFDKHSYSLIHQ
jgi:hypothetical protein